MLQVTTTKLHADILLYIKPDSFQTRPIVSRPKNVSAEKWKEPDTHLCIVTTQLIFSAQRGDTKLAQLGKFKGFWSSNVFPWGLEWDRMYKSGCLILFSTYRVIVCGDGQILPSIWNGILLSPNDFLRRYERSPLLVSVQVHPRKASQIQRSPGWYSQVVWLSFWRVKFIPICRPVS